MRIKGPRREQAKRGLAFNIHRSLDIASHIRGLIADGASDDMDIGLLETLTVAFPGITLHDYLGALFLYRARSGVPGYALHAPGRKQ